MKKIGILLLFLLIVPSILAIDIEVQQLSSEEIMIIGLDEPTTFNLRVTNNDDADDFLFYTFFGAGSTPIEAVSIAKSQTKDIDFVVSPRLDLTQRGLVIFNLFIQGEDGTKETIPLQINVLDVSSIFTIGSGEFDPDSNSLEIYIKNNINKNFDSVATKFKSPFFDLEETIPLRPYEKKNFNIQLDKEDFNQIMAGFYTLEANIIVEGAETDIEGIIKFSEKDILKTSEESHGFFIRTNTIKKSNQGNTLTDSEILIKKNIITRIFTTLSPQPDTVERNGAIVYYTWQAQIKPGETLEVVVRTNWFLPLLIIFLIVTIVVLTKKFTGTDLVLRKRVSFVHAKGGEFALKISLTVNAKKYLEKINIIDRLPAMVKVHNRFGAEQPTRVSEETKRIEWNFEKLEAGEKRNISYIIYSKIGVLGKFALPTAAAIYEKEGNIHEAESNHTFFVAEQPKEKPEDE